MNSMQATRGHQHAGRIIVTGILILSLSGCSYFAKRENTNPLCIAECPDLTVLPDDSFGATSKKLKEVADQYYLCRQACQIKK